MEDECDDDDSGVDRFETKVSNKKLYRSVTEIILFWQWNCIVLNV